MIRINLLPLTDRSKKRRISLPTFSGSGPMVVWVIAVVAAYAGMILAVSTLQSRALNDLEVKIAEAKVESEKLAPQLERIRKLTKEREEVNSRLQVIAKLDRDRYYRVKLLNDISESIPANCWLTSVKEMGGTTMVIDGVTFSNYIIADLMSNLDSSQHFAAVGLNIAQEGTIMDHRVIQFTLQSSIVPR